MASTDLECSTREAHDCPIFRFGHRGHVHVTAAGCVNNINNLGLSFSCDLQKKNIMFTLKSHKHCLYHMVHCLNLWLTLIKKKKNTASIIAS